MSVDGPTKPRSGRAAVPREHGAWVMLWLPILAGLAAGAPRPGEAVLLLVTANGLFVGQEGWRRPLTAAALAPSLVALAAGCWLWIGAGHHALGLTAAAAAVLGFCWFLLPSRRRARREAPGQILAVLVLSLGAPAGLIVGGVTDPPALLTAWLACAAWFTGGVVYVQMLLSAPKHGAGLDAPARWRIGRACLGYHLALTAGAASWAAFAPAGLLVGLGLLPAPLRAAWRYRRLGAKVVLKRVGLWEAAYGLWFAAWLVLGLRAS